MEAWTGNGTYDLRAGLGNEWLANYFTFHMYYGLPANRSDHEQVIDYAHM